MALTTTELAEFTKRSRELMNDGGEHWMKGEYKEFDDYDTLRFCSIGAVREILFDPDDVENVDIGDGRYKRIVKALAEAVREELKAGRYNPERHILERTLAGIDHEGIVIEFNDFAETSWADVERIFRRAEQTLAEAA